MTHDLELQKPGAGVPTPERLFLKYVAMPIASTLTPWEKSRANFKSKSVDILDVYQKIPPASRAQKILIDRISGLEDSSRFWSANMVLEHVMIVTAGVARVIVSLADEKSPNFEVRTQDVKPTGTLNESVAELFETAMRQAADALKPIQNRNSKATHIHPWFGEMNAHQWHTLLSLHHGIHLNQLREIAKILLTHGE